MRPRPDETPDDDRTAKREQEAERLIDQIEKIAPQMPLGYIMEGRLKESRKDNKAAITAYKRALEHHAGPAALEPLVALLEREGRQDELKTLPKEAQVNPNDIERLSAVQALRRGNKSRAEELTERAVKGDPDGIDIRLWAAEVLKALGKPEEAEAALWRGDAAPQTRRSSRLALVVDAPTQPPRDD